MRIAGADANCMMGYYYSPKRKRDFGAYAVRSNQSHPGQFQKGIDASFDTKGMLGEWEMNHDGWKGKLVIDKAFPNGDFNGYYVGQDKKRCPVQGRYGWGWMDTKIEDAVSFTVEFQGVRQQFLGYHHSIERNVISGQTTWENSQFGFFLNKIVENREEKDETSEKRWHFHLRVWGLIGKSEKPVFLDGEPNTDASHQEYTNWQEYTTKDSVSFGGDVSLEFFLEKFLSLEVGAAYAERRSNVENFFREGYSDKMTMKTLSVPILLKMNLGSDKTRFFFGGGFEGLFVLEMKNHYHWESSGLIYDEIFGADASKFGIKLKDMLDSPIYLNLMGTVGVRVGPLTVEARYLLGLKDMIFDFQGTSFNGPVNAGRLKGLLGLVGFSF